MPRGAGVHKAILWDPCAHRGRRPLVFYPEAIAVGGTGFGAEKFEAGDAVEGGAVDGGGGGAETRVAGDVGAEGGFGGDGGGAGGGGLDHADYGVGRVAGFVGEDVRDGVL